MKIVKADLSNKTHEAALLYLLDAYALDPMGGGEALSAYTQSHLAEAIRKRPFISVFIAFDEDEPAGLITCMEGFSTFQCKPLLNIHDVVVARPYRGRGLSKKLLAAAEALAIERGCCKLTLEVLEGNEIARAAYTSFGFHAYQLDPAYGRALFWEKKL